MKWLYLVFCSGLMAKEIDLRGTGEPISASGVWKWHEGDNPAWAAPDFDDSAWPTVKARGSALTLMSDGDVEATNAKGELFCFERTREISTKSARDIAEAAKAWGQTDDITVVTVRRNV